MALLSGKPAQNYAQYTADQFTGNGSTTTYTLSKKPLTPASLLVTIDGVKQHSNTYAIVGFQITFTEAPPNGSSIECVAISNQGITIAPSDNSVSTVKIAIDAVVTDRILNKNVTSAKLEDNLQITSLGIGTAASGTAGEIRAANAITSYYSDERLKTKVSDIENALDKVMQLSGFLYVENEKAKELGFNNTKTQLALSAQDVQRVLPEAVQPAPFDTNPDGTSISGENYLTVQYEKIVPLLVEAIKELKNQIDAK